MAANTTEQKIQGIGCLVVLVLVGLWQLRGCISPAARERPGSPAVYQRIESLTDCSALQAEFEVAYQNANRVPVGSKQHEWSTAYMSAIDDRMRKIGCYDRK